MMKIICRMLVMDRALWLMATPSCTAACSLSMVTWRIHMEVEKKVRNSSMMHMTVLRPKWLFLSCLKTYQ